jgi:hypothetical protein
MSNTIPLAAFIALTVQGFGPLMPDTASEALATARQQCSSSQQPTVCMELKEHQAFTLLRQARDSNMHVPVIESCYANHNSNITALWCYVTHLSILYPLEHY